MQLLDEGYIYALPKKGYYVSHIAGISVPQRIRTEFPGESPSLRNLTEFPGESAPLRNHSECSGESPSLRNLTESPGESAPEKKEENPKFDFSSSKPESKSFPFSVWARLIRTTLLDRSDELLRVSEYNGIPELRKAISSHLSSFRGMDVDPSQIIIGAGTEYLYGLIIKLLGKDKKYCIENPGFRKISQIYESEGISYTFANMDDLGMSVSDLKESGAEIAHLSPTHHFPTGITMPIARRYELLSWASDSPGRYIIEDDYDSEFRQKGSPIPPLHSIDTLDKVIYINTFSKSLASTVRIAYMVLPVHLARKYKRDLSFYSCTVSTFDQYTLASFISDGYFEKHINRMRLKYGKKREQVLGIIHDSLMDNNGGAKGKYRIVENDSGLHFILEIKTGLCDNEIKAGLLKKGIKILAVSDFYMGQTGNAGFLPPQGRFIIDYSNMDVALLPHALKELKEFISGI
ncbi:MAG: PLP-dependent aminotransferase family protein [Butyrivibrio sp.]|nr:PLP-dependent aminotransferase family protein [Butyrivibrio sp.]